MQPFVEVTQNNLMLTTSFMHNIQTTANTVYGMAAQLQIQHRQLSVMYIQIEWGKFFANKPSSTKAPDVLECADGQLC